MSRWIKSESSSEVEARGRKVTLIQPDGAEITVNEARARVFLGRDQGYKVKEDEDGSGPDSEPVAEVGPARPARNAKRGSSDGG
jgi:hypothetical protein